MLGYRMVLPVSAGEGKRGAESRRGLKTMQDGKLTNTAICPGMSVRTQAMRETSAVSRSPACDAPTGKLDLVGSPIGASFHAFLLLNKATKLLKIKRSVP